MKLVVVKPSGEEKPVSIEVTVVAMMIALCIIIVVVVGRGCLKLGPKSLPLTHAAVAFRDRGSIEETRRWQTRAQSAAWRKSAPTQIACTEHCDDRQDLAGREAPERLQSQGGG